MNTNRAQGFTLMELMAVVAIIFLLAAVSIPQYFKYIARVKQAEVAVNLASLHTAMQAFYAERGTYTNALNGPEGIGWTPAGYKVGEKPTFLYTYGFNVPGGQEGVHFFTGSLGTPPEFLGATFAETDDFVAAASGDIRQNGRIDVWTVDEMRRIENVHKGID